MSAKACKECRQMVPIEGYWLHNQAADGRHGVCAECMRARSRARAKDHPQRVRGRLASKAYVRRPDIMIRENERHAKRYYANHEKIRAQLKRNKFRRKYGITPEQADRMLVDQGGVCAICKTSDWTKSGPSVDHNHKTGRTRGILCNRCNAAIGFAKEDVTRLLAATRYIGRDVGTCLHPLTEGCSQCETPSEAFVAGIGEGLL